MNCEPFYQCPQSAFCGLLRFLYLVSNYEWIEAPYIIDLGVYTPQSNSSLQSAPDSYQFSVFKAEMLNARMNDSGMHSMYVCVPGLEQHSNWTKTIGQITVVWAVCVAQFVSTTLSISVDSPKFFSLMENIGTPHTLTCDALLCLD